jgi:hypothetical protein
MNTKIIQHAIGSEKFCFCLIFVIPRLKFNAKIPFQCKGTVNKIFKIQLTCNKEIINGSGNFQQRLASIEKFCPKSWPICHCTVISQFSFFFHVKILRVLKSHTIQVLLTFQICEIFWNAKSLQKGIKLEQSITIYQREMLTKK